MKEVADKKIQESRPKDPANAEARAKRIAAIKSTFSAGTATPKGRGPKRPDVGAVRG